MGLVRGGSRRISIVAVLSALVVTLLPATAGATVTPEEVIGGRANQLLPFGNAAYVDWSANTRRRPDHYNAFAKNLATATRSRLNEAGTIGWSGGFDPGTNTVIYQQIESGSSDLFFYDLDTGTRTSVSGVDTRRWEWGPRISTSYILFDRDYRKNGVWYTDIRLFDRTAATTALIATLPISGTGVVSDGGVGESYAWYTVCRRNCYAYVYNIAAGTVQRIPTVNRHPQYAPAVDETNGTVYWVRSGFACGAKVNVWRAPLSDMSATTKVVDLEDGIDTDWAMSLAPNATSGGLDLLFGRVDCASGDIDVYAARDVSAVPSA
jgi:hypothetical protein